MRNHDLHRLSLKSCAIYNPGDRVAKLGAGPRFVMGDDWTAGE